MDSQNWIANWVWHLRGGKGLELWNGEREERESWTYSPEGRRREHRGRSPEDRRRGAAVAGGEEQIAREQRAESTEGEESL
jgi:hypothetical protein